MNDLIKKEKVIDYLKDYLNLVIKEKEQAKGISIEILEGMKTSIYTTLQFVEEIPSEELN